MTFEGDHKLLPRHTNFLRDRFGVTPWTGTATLAEYMGEVERDFLFFDEMSFSSELLGHPRTGQASSWPP